MDKWHHPQTLQMLQVENSLHLRSSSPKKVGSEQVAQLMTTNPKRPRQYFKNAQCRELRWLIYFSRRRIIQEECTSWNSLGKKGNCKEGVWEINCSNLIWCSLLAERIDWQVQDWYWVSGLVLDYLLHLVPTRETRASSGVLRSRCLSAIQELVGRNGLPLLLSSKL